jgi:UDP-N-acetylmuramate dehydrogenase
VGSVFKNPPGRFVAQLIEECGLKGAARGGARISPLHANFIENHDGAKASDVLALVERARAAVRERFGIELELEMKVVGEPA